MIARPSARLLQFSIAGFVVLATTSAALGWFWIAASYAVLAGLSAVALRQSRERPLARVESDRIELHGASLSVRIHASTLSGWRRDGKSLVLTLDGPGEIVIGPFHVASPVDALQRILGEAHPGKSGER